MSIRTIMQGVSLVCALVALGAVLLWAPVCSGMLELVNGNMAPMRCSYAGKTAVLLALILAIVCVAGLVAKRTATVAVLCLSLALIVITFPTFISGGVCASTDMACQTTALWLRVCGAVSAVAAIAAVAANPDRKRVREV